MKIIVNFILILFVLMSCYPKDSVSYSSLRNKDLDAMRAFYSYVNPDGTKNVYIVDSVLLDSNEQVLIYSPKTKKCFVVSKSLYEQVKTIKDNVILKESGSFVFRWSFANGRNASFLGFEAKDENPSGHKFVKNGSYCSKGDYDVYEFDAQPLFLRVYIVRGDVLNYMDNNTNEYKSPYRISFPEPRAFYKVVVPVWKTLPNSIRQVKTLPSRFALDDYKNWSPKFDNVRFKVSRRKNKVEKMKKNDIKKGKTILYE